MQIECPACGASGETEEVTFRNAAFSWSCPGCRRLWDVRSVFFERSANRFKDLSATTKRLRVELGMTQTQLGDLVGVSAAYISHIENGKKAPAPALGKRILEALGAHDEAALV